MVIFVIRQYYSSENYISNGYTDVHVIDITWSHERVPSLKDVATCTLGYSSIHFSQIHFNSHN